MLNKKKKKLSSDEHGLRKESFTMATDTKLHSVVGENGTIDLRGEIEGLFHCLTCGDKRASVHLARLIEADTQGTLQPFAEALSARLCDHLHRYAESGVVDPNRSLEDEVYGLLKIAAIDWDGFHKPGRPGEEA
jgi:hypothetical protein